MTGLCLLDEYFSKLRISVTRLQSGCVFLCGGMIQKVWDVEQIHYDVEVTHNMVTVLFLYATPTIFSTPLVRSH